MTYPKRKNSIKGIEKVEPTNSLAIPVGMVYSQLYSDLKSYLSSEMGKPEMNSNPFHSGFSIRR